MTERNVNPMDDDKGYLTDEQVDALLGAAESNPRDYLLIFVLLNTGRRISEIVKGKNGYGIKPIDIDFTAKNITYNILKKNPRTKMDIEHNIPQEPPIRRTLPVNQDVLTKLNNYITMNQIKATDFIFPITRNRARAIIRKVGRRAGVEEIGEPYEDGTKRYLHPHHFRHTFAVRITRNPKATFEDIVQLKDLLQHSDINMTMTYLRYGNTRMRELVDSLTKKKDNSKESEGTV